MGSNRFSDLTQGFTPERRERVAAAKIKAAHTVLKPTDALQPCRECGQPGRVIDGTNEHFTGMLWVCSDHGKLGGRCESPFYLTEAAWNTRAARPEPQLRAVETGLEYAIEAANERGRTHGKDAVFDNHMKDIAFFERVLASLLKLKGECGNG